MKVSPREALLGWVTGMVILVGVSYWFVAPRVKIWTEIRDNQKAVAHRIELSKSLLQQEGAWKKQLEELREKVSQYPPEQDVTADYLKTLEGVAKDNSLTLGQRRPQKEKKHGQLYELPIDYTWEGDLKSLVHFLFALHQEKVTMAIEEISISLVAGSKEKMKGTFTLLCIYARQAPEPAPARPTAKPPAVPDNPPRTNNIRPAPPATGAVDLLRVTNAIQPDLPPAPRPNATPVPLPRPAGRP